MIDSPVCPDNVLPLPFHPPCHPVSPEYSVSIYSELSFSLTTVASTPVFFFRFPPPLSAQTAKDCVFFQRENNPPLLPCIPPDYSLRRRDNPMIGKYYRTRRRSFSLFLSLEADVNVGRDKGIPTEIVVNRIHDGEDWLLV